MKKASFFIIFVTLLTAGCSKKSEKHSEVLDISKKEIKPEISPDSLSYNPEEELEESEEAPQELILLIPKGHLFYNSLGGDLNGDNLSDYILILKKNQSEDDENLLVQLIIRQKNKSLKLHSSNNEVLSNEEDSPLNEEDLSLDSTGTGFTVSYNSSGVGATSSRSDVEYHFQFDKKRNNWLLQKVTEESSFNSPAAAVGYMVNSAKVENPNLSKHQIDSIEANLFNIYNQEISTTKTSKDFGIVTFSQFKSSDYSQ